MRPGGKDLDFSRNEDQKAFVDSARAFAQGQLAPHAARWDAESIFPKEVLAAAGELGFMGMYTPERAGGLGMSRLDASLIVEELATMCRSGASLTPPSPTSRLPASSWRTC
ncbi:acyl-CoA dehydrogenase family protein [Kineobactrum salinum]